VEPEKKPFEPIQNNTTLKPEQVFGLMDQFMTEQPAHSQYGGVHTSALADCGTQLLQINDIGRHNTIDKIAGRILLDRLEVQTPVLVTSGRISSDMVQKAARMRAPFLVSMRSASDQGIALAKTYGITLISGARRGRFFLFSHPERITSS
jgi:FdhD protein